MIECPSLAEVSPHLVCLNPRVHTPDGTVSEKTCANCKRRGEVPKFFRVTPTVELIAERRKARQEKRIADRPASVRPRDEATTRVERSVFFGITSFERPKHLARCVTSIRKHYPQARIFVADHGNQKCSTLPADIEVIHLPFNVGLSAARNALVKRFQELSEPSCCSWSPFYFLLLEEDFLFTERTRIDRMMDVLKHHPEVGCVGGSLVNDGNYQPFAVDFETFRNVLCGHKSGGFVRVTDAGTPYRICDKVYNFALFRARLLEEHLWDERFKIGGEHTEYFARVSRAGKWLVAQCESVVCDHDRGGRDQNYQSFRTNTRPYLEEMYVSLGVKDFRQDKILWNEAAQHGRPNVLVYGVGHSGTTILTRMLFALGWQRGDADEQYAESVSVRELNRQLLSARGKPSVRAALSAALAALPEPWALKDPRFHRREILERWLPAFAELDRPPVLLWIRRDAEATIASYAAREDHYADTPEGFEAAERWARHGYDLWPWAKLEIRYEDLASAVGLFDR